MDVATLIVSLVCLGLLLSINKKITTTRRVSKQRIVIDTSTLMDGRVVELARTGFLRGEIIVSKRVVGEMQALADNGSSQKRERARLGLDVLQELQM